MIIFLPIKPQLTGGTSSFARKFEQGMKVRGHTVTFTFQSDYDVLLVAASCQIQYLLHAKAHHKRIIHRLDGVHYPTTVAGRLYLAYNFPIWLARQFADVTIYQSQYAKFCCERFLGKARSEREYVIYNGIDISLFSPPYEGGVGVVNTAAQAHFPTFLTAQKFRRRDQLEPLIKAVGIFRKKYNKNAKLLVAGNFIEEAVAVREQYKNSDFVEFLGPVNHGQLATLHKKADVFLYCHPNSSCPNNVLEAMASGLPICGVADGAMPEIVQGNGELIPAPGDGFFKSRELNLEDFADNLYKILENRESYSLASRKIAVEKFSLEVMIEQYLTPADRQIDI